MSFFAIFLIFLTFRILGFGMRTRTRQSMHWHHRRRMAPVQQPPQPRTETAYEALKRRFVRGEISDYQYERELDVLLKTPEGRAQI